MIQQRISWFLLFILLSACQTKDNPGPTVGFVDAFEDDTIGQARKGFLAALAAAGYAEDKGTLNVIYRNAQGDIPTLTQIIQYFVAQEVDLIATCPSLSTITAVQRTQTIPIFMMVSPTPELMNINHEQNQSPGNLYGVAEDLAYIDTSFSIIPKLLEPQVGGLRIGLLYNQSEPQSVDAYNRLRELAFGLGVELVARPVNTTADVQLVTGALLNEDLDAFFANPDNTVFGAFETILKACSEADVPIFTSEAGLVARGAVAAFGADIYQWGYQTGEQAVQFLESGSTKGMSWEMVDVRRRVYNPDAARHFNMLIPDAYEPIKIDN